MSDSLSDSLAERNKKLVKDFAKHLNDVLDSFGYPRQYSGRYTKLADKYEVSVQTSRKWCKGLGLPSAAVLLAMAQDFDTTVDALLHDHGLVHSRPLPPLSSFPIYEISGLGGGTLNTDFAQTGVMISSDLPFVAGPTKGKLALVSSWTDLESPEVRSGDVLLISLDCSAIVEGGVYIIRTPSMTAIRSGSVSLSDSVRFSKTDRAGAGDHADVPVRRLTFNSGGDFLAPAPTTPGGMLIVGRVVGYCRKLIPSRSSHRRHQQ